MHREIPYKPLLPVIPCDISVNLRSCQNPVIIHLEITRADRAWETRTATDRWPNGDSEYLTLADICGERPYLQPQE